MKKLISVILLMLLLLTSCGEATDSKGSASNLRAGIISIDVDGVKIPDFDQNKYEYTYSITTKTDKIPIVNVEAKGVTSSDITLTQATKDNLKASVKCKDEVYYITMKYEINIDKLNNTYYILNNEKQLNVAFIGGSVTQGYNISSEKQKWASLVVKHLQDSYKKCKINYKNVGVGGTGSLYGAYRLATDLKFGSYKPDLVFIDFAINDAYDKISDTDSSKYMESIINQIYDANPKAEIVIVGLTDSYNRATDYRNLTAHKAIADMYKILFIPVGKMICEELVDRKMVEATASQEAWVASEGWKYYFFDIVHPTVEGHAKFAEYINGELDFTFKSKKDITKLTDSYRPEKPKNALLKNPSSFNGNGAKLSGGFSVSQSNGNIYTEKEGATLTVKFKGSSLILLCYAYVDGGTLIYSVDGGSQKELLINRNSTGVQPFKLLENLEDKEHTVVFKTKKTPNASAKITIQNFLIDGDSKDKHFSVK